MDHGEELIEVSNEYRDSGRYFCMKCYRDGDLQGHYKVNIDDVDRIYGKIIQEKDALIEELNQKVKILEAMIEYQPDGPGYERAKTHFSELSTF